MSLTNVFRVALSQTSHLASPWSHGDNQSQLPCGKPPGWEKCPSPLEALLLQQALERGQVPNVGCVVQPRVLAVLQGVVAELLPQPLLQVTTCTGDRAAGLSPAKRQVLKKLWQGNQVATGLPRSMKGKNQPCWAKPPASLRVLRSRKRGAAPPHAHLQR